ncbi:unnamed protein product, partial [Prorocentrum cordatum]
MRMGLVSQFVVVLLAPLVFCVSASRIRETPRNFTVNRSTDIYPLGNSHDADADVLLFGKPKLKTKFKSKGRARGPANARSESKQGKQGKENVTEIAECEEPFPAPEQAVIMCPEECPLMRFSTEHLCHFRCISEAKCATYPGVVNRYEGYCRVCAVPGCKRCETFEQVCRECHEGFVLESGECLSKSTWKWHLLMAVLGGVGLLVLLYVLHLAWRPVVSQNALDWGLEHRSRSKAREDVGTHDLYDLNLSLADTVTSAGGIGASLHFSWQRMVLLWSAAVTVAAMGVVYYHGRLNVLDIFGHPLHDEAEGTCSDRLDPLAEEHAEALRISILWLTGIVYVVSSIGAVYWAWWQQRRFIRHEDGTTDMRDYAVTCRGFPEEAEEDLGRSSSDKLEDEYKQFFKSAWGECVIGVSISWNMEESHNHIMKAVSDIVHDLVRKHKAEFPEDDEAQYFQTSRGTPRERGTPRGSGHSRTGCLCGPLIEAVDGLWFGEVPPCLAGAPEEEPEAVHGQLKTEFLRRLKTTGLAVLFYETFLAFPELRSEVAACPVCQALFHVFAGQLLEDGWDNLSLCRFHALQRRRFELCRQWRSALRLSALGAAGAPGPAEWRALREVHRVSGEMESLEAAASAAAAGFQEAFGGHLAALQREARDRLWEASAASVEGIEGEGRSEMREVDELLSQRALERQAHALEEVGRRQEAARGEFWRRRQKCQGPATGLLAGLQGRGACRGLLAARVQELAGAELGARHALERQAASYAAGRAELEGARQQRELGAWLGRAA